MREKREGVSKRVVGITDHRECEAFDRSSKTSRARVWQQGFASWLCECDLARPILRSKQL